jgi:D-ribose pyranose/furanose isomerase RbsD
MSTYLQGVTDFIPQFQPFQPDLNFYATALQTKQNQYDTNYKALNNVYGQYFYADLTHGDNLKKKDELIKAIDFNLKRVSGLDLSLDQNVDQATQVFKPFYQDKHLMKDMAWTKNINSEKAYGAGLKNSRDEKQRSQYWDDGLKFLQYKTEEFKEASLEETMNMGNVSYTPYVNVIEKAQKIAKDQGYKVETIRPTADGKWMVKTTNGENILEPLNRLLEAQLGSDPAVIDVYKTQAYINRKDYAYSNAARFNGDKNAAEMSYLTESYKVLKTEADARKVELEKQNNVTDTKIDAVKKAVSTGNATPNTASYLERLQEAKNITTTLETNNNTTVSALSTKSSTATTSTGFENPYGDVESLRYNIDNAMASKLMQKDLGEAADLYARTHREVDYEANIYAVKEQEHGYRMQEVASANASRERSAQMIKQSTLDAAAYKEMYDSKAYTPDLQQTVVGPDGKTYANPNYMRPILNPDADAITTRQKDRGASSDEINVMEQLGQNKLNSIDENVTPYLKQMLSSMRDLKGQLSTQDIENVLGKGMTIDKFNEQLQAAPQDFVRKTLGANKLKKITDSFQQLVKSNYNKGNSAFDIVGKNMLNYNINLNNYYTQDQNLQKWKTSVNQDVRNYVLNADPSSVDVVDYLFDKQGNPVSKAVFESTVLANKKVNKEDLANYENWKKVEAARKRGEDISNTMTDVVSNAPGFGSFGFGILGNVAKVAGALNSVMPQEGRYSIYDPKINPGTARVLKLYDYDKLHALVMKGYSSDKIRIPPPGIPALGRFGTPGLTTIGEHGVNVYADAPNTVGAFSWRGFQKDLNRLNFDKDIQVRFNGPVKTGANNVKEGKALIEEAFHETSMRGGTLKGFRLAAQPLALNTVGKGAMIFYPDAEWLKKHTYTETAEGKKGPGIISQDMANNALQNGISFISDEKNWSNHMYQQTKVTPIEANVEFNSSYNQPYVIDDPNDDSNGNKFTVEKDKILGGYTYKYDYKYYNPKIKDYEVLTVSDHGITSGQQLEKASMDAFGAWEEARDLSNQIFNNANR